MDAGAKSESAGNALGAEAESDPATQGVSAGSAQTGGDYEYVSSGPVTVNGIPLDEWYAAQQYDSSLGIGQPVYSPSPSEPSYAGGSVGAGVGISEPSAGGAVGAYYGYIEAEDEYDPYALSGEYGAFTGGI